MLRVAVARLDDTLADAAMPGWLGADERRRWAGLRPAARGAFVGSRALLRRLLQQATGVDAAAWDVSATAGSAPVARSAGGQVCASLSHRLGWVAAAVSDRGVGVDIEAARPARSEVGERAALVLSPAEQADWQALPPAAREAALLTRWTVKEAWFKAAGPDDVPWDFRRLAALAGVPAVDGAAVRTWTAAPLHVALCAADGAALAAVECDGLPGAAAHEALWQVRRVD